MKDITNKFENYYHPSCALVFYQSDKGYNDSYVEYYDMNKNGSPINAHPLSLREAKRLADALHVDEEKDNLLRTDGILDSNILSFNAQKSKIVWFTKAQKRQLFFNEKLDIACDMAHTPAMLWVADRESLSVYALAGNRRPTTKTPLYHAPFFNVDHTGDVCMGTVDIEVKEVNTVKAFTALWESYFFNSYFSHLMQEHNPVDGNCVMIWKSLVGSDNIFPTDKLVKNNRKLKDILL